MNNNTDEAVANRWEIEQRSSKMVMASEETKKNAIQTAKGLHETDGKTYWVWDAINKEVVFVHPI